MNYSYYLIVTKSPAIATAMANSDSDSIVPRQWVMDAASNIGVDSPDKVMNIIIAVLVVILFGIVAMLIKDNR